MRKKRKKKRALPPQCQLPVVEPESYEAAAIVGMHGCRSKRFKFSTLKEFSVPRLKTKSDHISFRILNLSDEIKKLTVSLVKLTGRIVGLVQLKRLAKKGDFCATYK